MTSGRTRRMATKPSQSEFTAWYSPNGFECLTRQQSALRDFDNDLAFLATLLPEDRFGSVNFTAVGIGRPGVTPLASHQSVEVRNFVFRNPQRPPLPTEQLSAKPLLKSSTPESFQWVIQNTGWRTKCKGLARGTFRQRYISARSDSARISLSDECAIVSSASAAFLQCSQHDSNLIESTGLFEIH